jgi:TnpA family transposase
LGLRRLVDHQQREPLAAIFGGGFASSSDGQFFRAGGFGRDTGRLNAHYGDEPGSKFYTRVPDRFAPFYTKVIAETASEALHILDGLLYHQSEIAVRRHHTDGGGDSEHVFALLALLGSQFAPRIPDLKHRRLYSFAKPSVYPTLEPLIAGRICYKMRGSLVLANPPESISIAPIGQNEGRSLTLGDLSAGTSVVHSSS